METKLDKCPQCVHCPSSAQVWFGGILCDPWSFVSNATITKKGSDATADWGKAEKGENWNALWFPDSRWPRRLPRKRPRLDWKLKVKKFTKSLTNCASHERLSLLMNGDIWGWLQFILRIELKIYTILKTCGKRFFQTEAKPLDGQAPILR